ncbi:MAG: carboxylating nicotinate-nucleotide diphosphorylase [Nitrososphaeria archaeon]
MFNLRSIDASVKKLVEIALKEDIGLRDVTSQILIPLGLQARGDVLVKEEGILAGTEISRLVFKTADSSLRVRVLRPDGSKVKKGEKVMEITGSAATMLKAERVALNFLQRLSGVATHTSRYVRAVEGLPVKIMDTRKTAPGLRRLEKHAVLMGGGVNHRLGLYDGVIIKDNHLRLCTSLGTSLADAVLRAKQKAPRGMRVEVEAKNLDEVQEALNAGADIIMLDNMSIKEVKAAVELVAGRIPLEASGGVSLENVRSVAETEVDMISVGALTHSAPSLDISLEIYLRGEEAE